MYNPSLHFHFTGIGGSGMSGLAEILLRQGFRVSGSDLRIGESCRKLIELGAELSEGHSRTNLPEEASLLVFSSAVSPENPEVLEAKRRRLPVIPRAEVLAELMRLKFGVAVSGSHGKTSTTSMIAAVCEAGGLDPTVIIGGVVKSIGTGSKLGKGDFLIAESDESDRSFLLLRPTIAIVTNIDSEHLSAYHSMAELESSFQDFAESVPFYGLGIFCIDDPRVRKLYERYSKRKVSYGLSPDADISATDITQKKTLTRYSVTRAGKQPLDVRLPMPGEHFLVNSLAAVAVGAELNLPDQVIQSGLAGFGGVARRSEIVGEGQGITVISDYGHHPTEVRATLRAVRAGWNQELRKLHVIFQPHRYTRTRDCFVDFLSAFDDADELYLLPIYAASERPIDGVSSEALCEALRHRSVRLIQDSDDIHSTVQPALAAGDVVVFLGAGSVGAFSEQFVRQLGLGDV